MNDIEAEFQAAEEIIIKTLKALNEAQNREKKGIIELAAISTFLHNIYSVIERFFKRTLKFKGIDIPSSETWHRDLLNITCNNEIISLALSKKLEEYLAFRHFFIHGYGVILDEKKLMPLATKVSSVWKEFKSEIKNFLGKVKSNKN